MTEADLIIERLKYSDDELLEKAIQEEIDNEILMTMKEVAEEMGFGKDKE